MLIMAVDLKFQKEINHECVEMFNLKDKDCQKRFKQYTTETESFSNCFISKDTFEKQFIKWQKIFTNSLYA